MKDEVRRLGSLKRTSKGHASLTVTGVGKEKALAAVASLCDGGNPPSLVLSIGFSGALSDDLSVGDLVLARRLVSTDGSPPLTIDLRLFQLAEAAIHENALPYVRRDTLTASRLVRTRSEREKLHREFNAPGRQPGRLLDMPRRLTSRRTLRIRAGDFGHNQPGAPPLRGRNHAPAGGRRGCASS